MGVDVMSEVLYDSFEDVTIPEGLKFLIDGYLDYAKELAEDRAIPKIDGFKPSQRRILYTMKKMNAKEFKKSASIIGHTLELHPHGDAALYETMCRMVDTAGYTRIPFLIGEGGFGFVGDKSKPSAMRYTSACLAPISKELFSDMDGIDFVMTEDGNDKEPDVLPTTFPHILCVPNTGIAVGLSSNIPSFNLHEVNNAVIELIETGDIKNPLAPDFPTKGYYVYDEKELRKVMETGKGKIKIRGKWLIDGKNILIDEIPYYTTIEAIKKKAEQIQGVSRVVNKTGLGSFGLKIECQNKKVVEYVLSELLRTTDLQMTITTNIVVIIDGKVKRIGVKELLKEWVKFRKKVLERVLSKELENVKALIPRYELLLSLLRDEEKRLKFVETLAKQGDKKARELLREWYKGTDESIFDWILDMKLRSFSVRGDRSAYLENLKNRKVELENDLADLDKVIVRQLKELNSTYSFPRLTQITDEDYEFEKPEKVTVKAEAVPVVVVVDGKFVKKIRLTRGTEHLEGIRCKSDDVISFIDTQGRLLRVALENIPFVSEKERGVYLPVYLEVEDDFDIVCYDLIEDKKVGYVYSDGFASVVDYSEWVDSKRATRITHKGVSPLASLIVGEIDFSKNYLLLITKNGRFGFVSTEFKHKHRTARTKLVNVKPDDEIVTVVSLNYKDIMNLVSAPEKYMGKLSLLAHGDTFNSEYLQTLL